VAEIHVSVPHYKFFNMARMSYTHTAINSNPATANLDGGILREPVLWKLLLLIGILYLVWSEKLAIVLDLAPTAAAERLQSDEGQKVKASLLPDFFAKPGVRKKQLPKAQVTLPYGTEGNYRFVIDPGYAQRNGVPVGDVSVAMTECENYVSRFAPVAVAEMRKFGIPASIVLAQGLLESDAGASKLARNTNNHFGMKCFSNRCKKGHCVNFSDDSHKDFFVKFGNVWSSYRAHSKFLKNSRRYAQLFQLDATDYRGWARGLARAGYATDKKYGEKLIALIQNLHLHQYDQQ